MSTVSPITVPEGTPPGVIIVDAQPNDGSEGAQTPITVVASASGSGNGDGNGDGPGTVAGAGDGDDGLAATGANIAALIAAMVLLLGAGAVMIKRRREISQAFATAMGRMSGDKPAV